jgi:signal transduction histidine kinase/DNA-binding response OmpR family regulator
MGERKPTILHVDDDEANRYAVTRSLVKAGFDVTEAATGQEALRKISDKPDLVILDIRLPDIDGFEVCRRIKGNPATAGIPVLHLSASLVSSADKAQGLDGGAEAYLVRPVEPIELVATVNALLRGKATEEALRASEERFSLAVEAGELGTFHCPMPLGRIVWNDKCNEHFWLPPQSEISFELFYSLIHPDDRDHTRQAVDAAVFQGKSYDVQYRTVSPTGNVRWIRAKGRAYYDAAGVPSRFDGVTLDITDIKRVEAERERTLEAEQAARAEAQRASHMKDEFLATLSHELRTPLNAIVGWAQILRNGTMSAADLAEGLAAIDRNARAQTQIIEDLLDMSRIVSGKIRLDVQQMDLAVVIESALDTVRPSADAKSVRLQSLIDPKVGVVTGDPNRLHQVFWNLLTNAIKFTPKEGRVQVVVARVNSHVEVSVIDTGEGIRPEFLPHVFDRFRQADASTTRRHGGLGLGLSIVKQLVELHGGTVRAKSGGAGEGATFVVTLPTTVIYANSAPEAERRHPSAGVPSDLYTEGCERLDGVRALVVDDEPDARSVIKRLLEKCGVLVMTAANASEAIALIERERPDILISDIGMPNEDGYTLIRRVRALGLERGGGIPALALTAYARAEDRVRAVRAGFQTHVVKPFEPAELITMVASLTGRSA